MTRDRGYNVSKRTREHRVATKDREHIEREMYSSETGQKVNQDREHTQSTQREHRESV